MVFHVWPKHHRCHRRYILNFTPYSIQKTGPLGEREIVHSNQNPPLFQGNQRQEAILQAQQTEELLRVMKTDCPCVFKNHDESHKRTTHIPCTHKPLARWSWSRGKVKWRFQQLHFQGRPSYCRLLLGGSRSLRHKLRWMVKRAETFLRKKMMADSWMAARCCAYAWGGSAAN